MDDEQRYRLLIEQSPFGIFQTDHVGACTYVNPRWCALAGLPQERALGDGWAAAVHPAEQTRVVAIWDAIVRSGRAAEVRFRVRLPTGEIRWVRAQAGPLRDPVGQPLGWMGTLHDLPSGGGLVRVEAGELAPAAVTGGVLSPREQQVLALLAQGQTSKEIATALTISPRTVETHRANMMQKLEARTLADLVRYAIRNGFIPA